MGKILITGGCGFIGTNMAVHFAAKRWDVVVMDNLVRKGVTENIPILEQFGCDIRWGDVRNAEDFKAIPDVDAVINLAANPGIPWSIENPIYDAHTNMMGALNVFEFARKCGACVIQASTNKVYSDEINDMSFRKEETRYKLPLPYENGISERFPVDGRGRPHSPYGCSKLGADIYAQEYNTTFDVPTVVCRMSAIYGPHQMGVSEQGWVVWFMYCKKHNIPLEIFGDGLQVRDCLYIDDLCTLYYLLIANMEKHRGSVFNVGGGKHNALSVIELINWLNKKEGDKLKTTYKDWRVADHKVYISDTTKVIDETGWFPLWNVDDGLQKTWEWVNR